MTKPTCEEFRDQIIDYLEGHSDLYINYATGVFPTYCHLDQRDIEGIETRHAIYVEDMKLLAQRAKIYMSEDWVESQSHHVDISAILARIGGAA